MQRIAKFLLIPTTLFWLVSTAFGQWYDFKTVSEINSALGSVKTSGSVSAKTDELATTASGNKMMMLELVGKNTSSAVLVVANMEGNSPLASEAAIRLANLLADDWSDQLDKAKFYIVPLGNPDGYARYFDRPQAENFTNGHNVNADKDNATDEDGPDDLNKDGFITKMRKLDPEGQWIEVISNPLLMRKADRSKGEVGMYKLYPEGIDNDGDGKINEDGPGGVNPGHNFPHEFEHYTADGGLFAASENESRALLEFCFAHPEIAMVLTFTNSSTLKEAPQGGRKASADQEKYKVPERWAKRMGLDPETEYPIKELLELARDYTGYDDLTEDQLIQWLGVGAAVNPDKSDLEYWNEISKKYNDFLKEAELDGKRLDPQRLPSGSIEEWAYFQYGVPTFAMDFWTLPEPKEEKKEEASEGISLDSLENMTNEQFIDLGEEKIAEFLKQNDAPAMYTAEMVINALKGGMMDTKKMAKFMRKSKKSDEEGGPDEKDKAMFAYDPDAYVAWKAYDHPTLGKVEIGGMKPFADLLPKADEVDSLLDKQLPYVKELTGLLPTLKIIKSKVRRINADVFRVECWVANQGFLPYPTHQGKRCQRPSPPAIKLDESGLTVLEGEARVPIGLLEGSGGVEKISWLVQGAAGKKVGVDLTSFSAGNDAMTITLSEGETIR